MWLYFSAEDVVDEEGLGRVRRRIFVINIVFEKLIVKKRDKIFFLLQQSFPDSYEKLIEQAYPLLFGNKI